MPYVFTERLGCDVFKSLFCGIERQITKRKNVETDMDKKTIRIPIERIEQAILLIRGQKVMLG